MTDPSRDAPQPCPTTRWSLVRRAGDALGDDADGVRREALAALLLRYMPAMRAHLFSHGASLRTAPTTCFKGSSPTGLLRIAPAIDGVEPLEYAAQG